MRQGELSGAETAAALCLQQIREDAHVQVKCCTRGRRRPLSIAWLHTARTSGTLPMRR